MQLKSLKALNGLDDDQLAEERQSADEEIVKLKDYKRDIQVIVDDRLLKARLERAGFSGAEIDAAAQAVVGLGGIETAEEVNG